MLKVARQALVATIAGLREEEGPPKFEKKTYWLSVGLRRDGRLPVDYGDMSPRSARLVYVAPAMMRWSCTGTPINWPASTSWRVIRMSSRDGSTFRGVGIERVACLDFLALPYVPCFLLTLHLTRNRYVEP